MGCGGEGEGGGGDGGGGDGDGGGGLGDGGGGDGDGGGGYSRLSGPGIWIGSSAPSGLGMLPGLWPGWASTLVAMKSSGMIEARTMARFIVCG